MKEESKNSVILSIGIVVVVLISLISVFISEWRKATYSDKQVFTNIYEKDLWGGGSGPGSKIYNAGPFLEYLQNFIDTQKISTIVDIGCGDWELMRTIRIPNHIKYLGLDIVDQIIAENEKKYAKDNVKFSAVDSVKDLSAYKGDLLVIKDVLMHWEKSQVFYAMKNIIPNFKYAIIVNSILMPEAAYTKDLNAKFGETKIIDLQKAPFSMTNLKFIMDYKGTFPYYEEKRIYLYVRDKSDPLFK